MDPRGCWWVRAGFVDIVVVFLAGMWKFYDSDEKKVKRGRSGSIDIRDSCGILATAPLLQTEKERLAGGNMPV